MEYGFSGVRKPNGILAEPQNSKFRWLYANMPAADRPGGPVGGISVMHVTMRDGVVDAQCDSCQLIKQQQVNYSGNPTNQHLAIVSTTRLKDQPFRVR